MAKKKEQKKEVSIYDEMDLPKKEVESTLPIEQQSYEEAVPKQPIQKPKEDYLDIDPSQSQQTQKNFSQPLMFGDEAKENLIADLLKVDWERVEHIIRGHKPQILLYYHKRSL